MTPQEIREILTNAQTLVEEETFADGSTVKTYVYTLTEQEHDQIFEVTE